MRSLWVDILGYPKIIDLIVSLVNKTIDYFYNNFTAEGKIVSLPRKVEAIEAIIDLRKQLKSLEANTDELDDTINKSSVLIAHRLNDLLLGEPRS